MAHRTAVQQAPADQGYTKLIAHLLLKVLRRFFFFQLFVLYNFFLRNFGRIYDFSQIYSGTSSFQNTVEIWNYLFHMCTLPFLLTMHLYSKSLMSAKNFSSHFGFFLWYS